MPPTVETTTPTVAEYDDAFYLEMINFKVENTHFQVPKWGFEIEGSAFCEMFTLPRVGTKENDGQTEGSSAMNPIVLEGISKSNFKLFIALLYPGFYKVARVGIPSPTPLAYDEWIGVLDLAEMWNFPKIREEAIEALTPLMATKKWAENMALARNYRVRSWLLDEYKKLITEHKSLDVNDLVQGGMDQSSIIKLFQIREKHLADMCTVCNSRCSYCERGYRWSTPPPSFDIHKAIEEEFIADFLGMN